jgi:hypothetical protein
MISEKIEREYNLFKFKDGSYSLSTNEEKGESCDVKQKPESISVFTGSGML